MSVCRGDPSKGLCRLVKEYFVKNDQNQDKLKVETLGSAGVLKLMPTAAQEIGYVGKKKCECFLAISAQILNREQFQVPRKQSDIKIVAEFLDKSGRKFEDCRVVVNDVVCSMDDVWKSKGMLYVAITKPPKWFRFWKTSLVTSRPLEVFHTTDQRRTFANQLSAAGELKCHVLFEGPSSFGFRPYNLVRISQGQNMSPADERYTLKIGELNVYTKKEFPEGENALGAVILKEEQFVGVLYFRDDQRLFPLALGAVLEEG